MAHCKQCGSNAYNQYELHGREPGVDVDLCDVCYWRKRYNEAVEDNESMREMLDNMMDSES